VCDVGVTWCLFMTASNQNEVGKEHLSQTSPRLSTINTLDVKTLIAKPGASGSHL
jgi:hypothetical protein